MPIRNLVYASALCALLAACTADNGPRALSKDEALSMVFDETYDRVTNSNVSDAAWWFKPYYKELVRKLDTSSFIKVVSIMYEHGRGYAIERLEPCLQSTTGEKQVLVAACIYSLSFCLHPKAEQVLRSTDNRHEIVSSSLHLSPLASQRLDEAARKSADIEASTWAELSKSEKWKALRKAWQAEGIVTEERVHQ